MKRFTKAILASSVAAALAAPMAVQAQAPAAAPASDHTFTGNFGLFSQYIFRGLTQTDRKPALQGGFDYAHSSGFYAGIWGSNISWITDGYAPGGSYSAEFDTYLGFKMPVGDFTFDVGFLRYNYPGRKPVGGFAAGTEKADTNELYGAVGWKWLTFKYSYSLGDTFGIKDSKGTDYMDLTGTFPIMDTGFSLVAHYGRQNYKGTNTPLWTGTGGTQNDLDYKDWRIAVTKEFMGLNFAVGYSKADTKAVTPTGALVYRNVYGRNIGEGSWTASVQKSF
jgi:uncharacterized protein (TIGR02001 family)